MTFGTQAHAYGTPSQHELDDGWFVTLQPQMLALDLPYGPFVSVVKALIALPPNPLIAAGELGPATAGNNLFWAYNKLTGLSVQTGSGFLTGTSGTGGFSLQVLPDGSWALQFAGSNTVIGYNAETHQQSTTSVPPPPAGNTVLDVAVNGADGGINGTAGNITVDGDGSAADPVVGYDTIQGGVGDYMIGGDGTLGGGAAGDGNCALYSASPGSVLVDMQNGNGYGGNAQGDVLVNMNQVRGSYFTNVLIGNANGTDLKSGGNDSLLISTGGQGFELRPDGYGNVLVSTVGADVIRFDPSHGWALGDDNISLGFNVSHGDVLDLSLIGSNFFSTSAAGYSASTGTGNINDYVSFAQEADGDHLMFSPTGNVQTAGIELLDMKQTFGLSAASLYQSHNLLI
jgi:hypothetical protein